MLQCCWTLLRRISMRVQGGLRGGAGKIHGFRDISAAPGGGREGKQDIFEVRDRGVAGEHCSNRAADLIVRYASGEWLAGFAGQRAEQIKWKRYLFHVGKAVILL